MGQILEHKHLIIRAELKNPPKCAEAIQDWMKLLVDKIDMKILMGPMRFILIWQAIKV